MNKLNASVCMYLKGSTEGARCGVTDRLVRCIEDADIKLCMSRRHEACIYYVLSLRERVLDMADSERAMEAL